MPESAKSSPSTTPSADTPATAPAPIAFVPYPKNFNEAIARLKGDLADTVRDLATDLLEGAASDIRGYATDIAFDLSRIVEVPSEKRQAVIDECLGQLRMLAEKNRIKTNVAGFRAFQRTLAIIINVAGVAANAASMNIPGLVDALVSPLLAKVK